MLSIHLVTFSLVNRVVDGIVLLVHYFCSYGYRLSPSMSPHLYFEGILFAKKETKHTVKCLKDRFDL